MEIIYQENQDDESVYYEKSAFLVNAATAEVHLTFGQVDEAAEQRPFARQNKDQSEMRADRADNNVAPSDPHVQQASLGLKHRQAVCAFVKLLHAGQLEHVAGHVDQQPDARANQSDPSATDRTAFDGTNVDSEK